MPARPYARLPQLGSAHFRRLLPPQSFLVCLRQRGLGLDITPRRRKILLQLRGPLALLLQLRRAPPPALSGRLRRLLSPPVPFEPRRHAALPQDPASAARTARARHVRINSHGEPHHPFRVRLLGALPLSKYPQEAPAGALGAAEHHRWALWALEADLGIQHLAHGFT